MDICDHGEREQNTIRTVRGTVMRHAMALVGGGENLVKGAAQLRDITTDPHLLAHGIPPAGAWYYDAARELLLAAGADLAAID